MSTDSTLAEGRAAVDSATRMTLLLRQQRVYTLLACLPGEGKAIYPSLCEALRHLLQDEQFTHNLGLDHAISRIAVGIKAKQANSILITWKNTCGNTGMPGEIIVELV